MNFTLSKSNLNFRVYTTPNKPTAPGAENDIAIISSVPMGNWIMSPEEPFGVPRNDGDVWIQYSTKGDTRNVLKQNCLIIATINAWQYVDSAWINREAFSCQGGAWAKFFDAEKYLFYYSREKYKWQGRAWAALADTGAEVPSVTTNADGSKSISFSNSAAAWRGCAYELEKDVNLTNISTITALVDFHISDNTANGNMYLLAIDRNKTYWFDGAAARAAIENGDNQTVTLDVRGLSGSYDIAIAMYINNGYKPLNATTTLREMKME